MNFISYEFVPTTATRRRLGLNFPTGAAVGFLGCAAFLIGFLLLVDFAIINKFSCNILKNSTTTTQQRNKFDSITAKCR